VRFGGRAGASFGADSTDTGTQHPGVAKKASPLCAVRVHYRSHHGMPLRQPAVRQCAHIYIYICIVIYICAYVDLEMAF
jgi:hypothetical protein